MAYDFSGPWVERTAHQSQLFTPAQPHNISAQLSCQAAIEYVLEQGVRPNKVLLGVPLYGRSFLDSDNIDQSFSDCGGESGCFDYCDLPRPGATVHHDNEVCADYCSGGDGGFVTYDTPHTVKQKAKFVSDTGLGGLFYWQITADKKGCESLVETGYRTLHDI
jgi:chitinase